MADYEKAFNDTLAREGGFRLTNDPDDTGGQTYAGIARKKHPEWVGWSYIDREKSAPTQLVRDFYEEEFWKKIAGADIVNQKIAENIFDFAVNASPDVAKKLAQIVVQVVPDGVFGPKTIAALNAQDEVLFKALYALAKIARYRDIVNARPTQIKFLKGWINRTLEMAK